DRARWSVERCDKRVADSLNFAPAETREFFTNQLVVRTEQVSPAAIAKTRGVLCRSDDIREKNCGENTIQLRRASRAGEEFLDMIDYCVGIAGPKQVRVARELDEFRAGDILGNPASFFDIYVAV